MVTYFLCFRSRNLSAGCQWRAPARINRNGTSLSMILMEGGRLRKRFVISIFTNQLYEGGCRVCKLLEAVDSQCFRSCRVESITGLSDLY